MMSMKEANQIEWDFYHKSYTPPFFVRQCGLTSLAGCCFGVVFNYHLQLPSLACLMVSTQQEPAIPSST